VRSEVNRNFGRVDVCSLKRDRRVKSKSLQLFCHVAPVRKCKNVHKTLERKRLGVQLFGIQRRKYYDLDMDLKKTACED
jgi:hypothetical protein